MITDEMLCAAAGTSLEAYVSYLEADYDPSNQHVFSVEFEKKMRKLIRKARHPVFYQVAKRVAVILLAVLFSAGVWLSVDTQARATFFGWIREVYEAHIVYRFTGEKSTDDIPHYALGWLPEGYEEVSTVSDNDMTDILYINANNSEEGLIFSYYRVHSGVSLEILEPVGESHEVLICGLPGYFYSAAEAGSANDLIWVDEERKIVFSLSSFLPENDMLHIAESIFLEEPTN